MLDFIGRQHTRFRFDLRLRVLTGLSRAALPTTVRAGFPFLPAGCHMDLDPVATDIVLRNVRSQVGVTKRALAADVRSYGQVSLAEYLRHSGRDLGDIYRNGGSWTALCRAAGLTAPPAGPDEDFLLRRLSRLAHADDRDRLDGYRRLVAGPAPPEVHALTPRQQRLAAMLVFTFWPDGGGHASYDAALEQLWRHPAIRAEVTELLGLAAEDTRHVTLLLPGTFEPCPLALHARYSREELLAGLGANSLDRPPSRDREGVRWVAAHDADVFTFALHKSERDYSPTTMYRDYAISPSLVHWESQSTTSVDSPTGQRYLHHAERATRVLLFAREDKQYEFGPRPFFFLGPASYVSHQGSRPISFVWRLHTPMPADFFQAAALAA